MAALKPCAASSVPVTPLRPALASKPSARRCVTALRRVTRRGRVRRDGAGGFLRGSCIGGKQATSDEGSGEAAKPKHDVPTSQHGTHHRF
jgi:hypothetical protein